MAASGKGRVRLGREFILKSAVHSIPPPKHIPLGDCESPPRQTGKLEGQGCEVPSRNPQKAREWHLRSQGESGCLKEGKVKRKEAECGKQGS